MHLPWHRTTSFRAGIAATTTGALLMSLLAMSSTPAAAAEPLTFEQVAAGRAHSCALTKTHYVLCWGANDRGQLGTGAASSTPTATPTVVAGLEDVAQIDAGGSQTCAVLDDGTARCWGANNVGQLGDGTTADRAVATTVSVIDESDDPSTDDPADSNDPSDPDDPNDPDVDMDPLSDLVQISVGLRHTCAVDASNRAWCWGSNGYGQLGLGDASDYQFQVPPGFFGLRFPELAVSSDGDIATYDETENSITFFDRDGTYQASWFDIAGGGIKVPAADLTWGEDAMGEPLLYAMDKTGTIGWYATDGSLSGMQGVPPYIYSQIAAEKNPPLGRVSDLFVVQADGAGSWTLNREETEPAPQATRIWQTDLRNADGDPLTYVNDVAVSRDPTTGKELVYLAGSAQAAADPRDVRQVYVHDAGTGALLRSIRVGDAPGSCGLDTGAFSYITALTGDPDGNIVVVYWTGQQSCLVTYDPLGGVVNVIQRAGFDDPDALMLVTGIGALPDGRLVVADANAAPPRVYGPDGGRDPNWGRTVFRSTPQLVRPLASTIADPAGRPGRAESVTSITAGDNHTCAEVESEDRPLSKAFCWGANSAGQSGIATGSSFPSFPRALPFDGLADGIDSPGTTDFRFSELEAGTAFSCGVGGRTGETDTTFCWGSDASGQHLQPMDGVASTTTGSEFACALRTDGTVTCVGSNTYAQLGTGTCAPAVDGTDPVCLMDGATTLTGATDVSAGTAHACAVADDGASVYCWGRNDQKQLGTVSSEAIPFVDKPTFPESAEVVTTFDGPAKGSPTPPFTVSFDHDVSGVTGDNVTLEEDGTGDLQILDDAVCSDGAGEVTDCDTGSVRSVSLTPSTRLSCEASYVIRVNPPGTDPDRAVHWGPWDLGASKSDPLSAPCPTVLFSGPDTSSPDTASIVPHEGPFVVTFVQPVAGITDDNAVVARESDGGRIDTLHPVCRGADGKVVSCSSGPVRTAEITPVSPVKCGATFTMQVNPSGAPSGVRWGDFQLTTTSTTTPLVASCAVGSTDDTTGGTLSYQWSRGKFRSGGTFVSEDRAGATASYTFKGRRVDWTTAMGPAQGRARVWIDGENQGMVNNYATKVLRNVKWRYPDLGSGRHTLTIEVLGQKGARRAKGTLVTVDALTVYRSKAHVNNKPRGLTYTWGSRKSALALGGSYSVSRRPSASVSLDFTGTGVVWRTLTSPKGGNARVIVDGSVWGVVKTQRKTVQTKNVIISGLAEGAHTLVIKVIPLKPGGPTRQVAVDGFLAL